MVDEEDVTAQLLRLAGAPPDPSAERTARVHEAVHRAWRANRRRRMIRHGTAIGLLGVAAALVIAVWMNRPSVVVAPSNQVVAIGERIQGRPIVTRHTSAPLPGSLYPCPPRFTLAMSSRPTARRVQHCKPPMEARCGSTGHRVSSFSRRRQSR